MRRFLFVLILLLLPCAGVLGSGELMVRMLAPQNLSGTWLMTDVRGLTLNRPAWTARHQLGSRVLSYATDENGFRIGTGPAAAGRKILVLGDSFTFGWLLDEPDTYVARLQRRIDAEFGPGAARLLNAGVGGWGAGDYLAFLEEKGDRLAPDAVVIFVSLDDFRRAEAKPLYRLDADGTLIAQDLSGHEGRLKAITEALPLYPWLLEHSHLLQLVRRLLLTGLEQPAAAYVRPSVPGWAPPGPEVNRQYRPLALALYGRISAWCKQRNIPLLVTNTGWPSLRFGWMREVAATHGFTYADLQPQIGPVVGLDAAAYEFPEDGHPNPKGAALIAETAWPALRQFLAPQLLPARP